MAQQKPMQKISLSVTSPAFAAGKVIAAKYTCDGANVSPALSWSKGPAETRSYALIVDDPDAPGKIWSHWILFNLPPGQTSLDENIPKKDKLPSGAIQGRNDFGEVGYGGPCPPGGMHRYFFRVYCLDGTLDLDTSATRDDVLNAIKGRVLAEGELMGTYSRRK